MNTPIIPPAVTPRRQFVRTFVLGTVTTVVGRPWIATLVASLLAEGRAAATSTDGVLELQLSSFPPLLAESGSIRIGVNSTDAALNGGGFYPVIVSRGAGNAFYAVNSQCTHRGCVVDPFDGNTIFCQCHSSEFAIDGTRIAGPAQTDLPRYPAVFDGVNTLKITVPELGYSITRYALENGVSPRVRLEFPTFDQVQYEIRFRQTATAPWSVVPFATTLNGTADNTVLTGDGSTQMVFVNRTTATGFYGVAIIALEV